MLSFVAALALGSEVIRLWPRDAPGALGSADKDVPTITLYRPAHRCGSAVVICPGGGYEMLADHEGSAFALFMNRLGVTAFVLKYRLGSNGYRHPIELTDLQRAIRTVRYRAKEWKVDPGRIGVMGSSAGGHLAAMAVTLHEVPYAASDPIERLKAKPNFGILCYPVITMGAQGHAGSRHALLGDNPTDELIHQTSADELVSQGACPCFLWHTADDSAVPVANSQMFADALKKAKVEYELHIYEHGAHGLGLGGPPSSDKLLPWTKELARWMKAHKWAHDLEPMSN